MKIILKQIEIFDRIIIGIFFIILIFVINSYFIFLRKEYIININTVNEFNNISNGIIYFGKPSCPSCEVFKPILKEVLVEENVQIYYFDTDYFKQNNLLLQEELQNIFDKYLVTEVPILLEIKDGLVINTYDGNMIKYEKISYVKEQISKFISYGNFASKYIIQYTVLIILFLISVLVMIRFLYFTKISYHSYFVTLIFNIVLIILLILNGSSIIKVLDNYGYSARYEMSIINLASFVINILSIIRLCLIKKESNNY